jgi:hypothetical protein
MSDKLTEDFLDGITHLDVELGRLGFNKQPLIKKGFAFFAGYFRNETVVEFLFGPSDWDIEILINTPNGRFSFKDLLLIEPIKKWTEENPYRNDGTRNVKNELLWYLNLLKFSSPYL